MSASPAILLVEDDEAFRYAAGRSLRANGYSVVDVSTSMAALREVSSKDFDVAIVDVTLSPNEPHGVSLARMLRHKHPGTGILFVTGNLEIEQLEPRMPGQVLYKPVELADLLGKVREIVSDEAALRGPFSS